MSLITFAQLQAAELDCVPLGTIGGAEYYELHLIERRDADGKRQFVGPASQWPLIMRDVRIAELEALLDAERRHVEEAEEHIARLLGKQTATAPFPCPDCERSFPSKQSLVMHRMRKHRAVSEPLVTTAETVTEPEAPPVRREVIKTRFVRESHEAYALAMPDAPWRCAQCHSDRHTRSIADPARCIKCADKVATNGRALEVGT